MSVVEIVHSSGAKVTVDLFGATVTSWILPSGREMFYLSSLCDKTRTKPIRGGIPVVFPQFSNGKDFYLFSNDIIMVINRRKDFKAWICQSIDVEQ